MPFLTDLYNAFVHGGPLPESELIKLLERPKPKFNVGEWVFWSKGLHKIYSIPDYDEKYGYLYSVTQCDGYSSGGHAESCFQKCFIPEELKKQIARNMDLSKINEPSENRYLKDVEERKHYD